MADRIFVNQITDDGPRLYNLEEREVLHQWAPSILPSNRSLSELKHFTIIVLFYSETFQCQHYRSKII